MKASMKMKLKAVAAAVALAVVAGQANAAIDAGGAGLNSELFLMAWSPTLNGGTSYTRDLGISLQNFGAGTGLAAAPGIAGTTAPVAGNVALGASQTIVTGNVNAQSYGLSFALDTLLSSSGLLTAADTRWMVGAVDSTGGTANNALRTLTTANGPITGMTNNLAGAIPGSGNIFISGVNGTGTHASQANGSSVNVPGDQTAFGGYLGNNWNAGLTASATGVIGQALEFFMVTRSSTSGVAAASVYQYANSGGASTWNLSNTGVLTYTAAAIPLPAAVWLFGSGLLGLVGIARRRKLAELAA